MSFLVKSSLKTSDMGVAMKQYLIEHDLNGHTLKNRLSHFTILELPNLTTSPLYRTQPHHLTSIPQPFSHPYNNEPRSTNIHELIRHCCISLLTTSSATTSAGGGESATASGTASGTLPTWSSTSTGESVVSGLEPWSVLEEEYAKRMTKRTKNLVMVTGLLQAGGYYLFTKCFRK